jgi:hypothetical protein
MEPQGHFQSLYVLVETVTSQSRGSRPLAVVVFFPYGCLEPLDPRTVITLH